MVGHAVDIGVGIKVVVLRRNVDIVYVEKHSAVRQLDDLTEKFPFGHLGDMKLRIARNVFDADRHFQKIAHLTDFLRGPARRGERVGHRQEIVGVGAVDAAPAQVVGEPRRLRALNERLQFLEMRAVDLVGRTKIHRDPVLHDAVLLHDLVEHLEGPAAVDHEVFGDDLEPIDRGLLFENMPVVRHAQADADTVIGVTVKCVGGHIGEMGKKNAADKGVGRVFGAENQAFGFTSFFLSDFAMVEQPPLPLQEFLPLQPLSLVPQPPVPLQEL